jgi:hypothetical protein
VPALVKVNWNDAPAFLTPESNVPSRDVTECEFPDQVHWTVSPISIVRDAGEKSKSSTVTVVVAACADPGAARPPASRTRVSRLKANRAAERRVEGLVIGW